MTEILLLGILFFCEVTEHQVKLVSTDKNRLRPTSSRSCPAVIQSMLFYCILSMLCLWYLLVHCKTRQHPPWRCLVIYAWWTTDTWGLLTWSVNINFIIGISINNNNKNDNNENTFYHLVSLRNNAHKNHPYKWEGVESNVDDPSCSLLECHDDDRYNHLFFSLGQII